jgi:hypothetical protein
MLLFDRQGRLRRHYLGAVDDVRLGAEIMALALEDAKSPRETSIAIEQRLAAALADPEDHHHHHHHEGGCCGGHHAHDHAHDHDHDHAGGCSGHDHAHDHTHDHDHTHAARGEKGGCGDPGCGCR